MGSHQDSFCKTQRKVNSFFLHLSLIWFVDMHAELMIKWQFANNLLKLECSVCGFNLANFVMKMMNKKSKQG